MKKKHFYLLLCFLWMGIIFWFSAQVADDSQSMSNGIVDMINQIFHIDFATQGGWLYDAISFLVRKAAHMSEYAVLAILFAAYLKECAINNYLWWAIGAVFLYAASDEFHQLFVEGRSGQFRDVLIDSAGGVVGLLLQRVYYLIKIRFLKRRHQKIQSVDNPEKVI